VDILGWDDFGVWYFGRHELFGGMGFDGACDSIISINCLCCGLGVMLKVQGSTPLECKQFIGATLSGEKSAIYPHPYRKTSEGAVHGSRGISRGACKLTRTSKVMQKKKKKSWYKKRHILPKHPRFQNCSYMPRGNMMPLILWFFFFLI
jgi:hypothetical protein